MDIVPFIIFAFGSVYIGLRIRTQITELTKFTQNATKEILEKQIVTKNTNEC